jgi:hypothetical protein
MYCIAHHERRYPLSRGALIWFERLVFAICGRDVSFSVFFTLRLHLILISPLLHFITLMASIASLIRR